MATAKVSSTEMYSVTSLHLVLSFLSLLTKERQMTQNNTDDLGWVGKKKEREGPILMFVDSCSILYMYDTTQRYLYSVSCQFLKTRSLMLENFGDQEYRV